MGGPWFSVDGPVGRVVQRVASSGPFAPVASRIVPPLDRLLHRVTGGRLLLSQALLPSLVLTTIGRTTGQPRVVPLACLPDGDSLIVVASNFGKEHHPAWSANLLATPSASVSYRGRTFPVRAHLVEGAERDEVWQKLLKLWPVYARYTDRSGRELRIFRLVERRPPA